ncbi:type III secretion protein U [Herbaspirillum sp. Sphag1AN]|uniref:EscU/YscU/HrcU family type III secretion system export apparatus switch protein n=1 Tax=unclassified Herbaspirillum TaxID=2624150 RepID=UPI0016137D7F|nr:MULTISPECIES: EscU/YscU/HrcU family type III secretion system export apparatus switch protein [unclassified Herbaspirillum]MBB3211532.1 type III secretion protein U [Herbaspirillum sp. Sphag1AN]MBB3245202.1 type III secretion protein U [Herbaspirillum sp. Sphag64]
MSARKGEKPTRKKLRDAAKKGQTFKARDLVAACLSLCGVLFIVWFGSFDEIGSSIVAVIKSGFTLNMHEYVITVFLLGFKSLAPIIVISIIATALPSVLQSGFNVAPEALKLNFGAISPSKGLKRIFNLRTVKDFVKAILYLFCFGIALVVFWSSSRDLIFAQLHSSIPGLITIWSKLFLRLFLICLACVICVLILDALVELFLYLKDLRMDKNEVKREHKELEGDPLLKTERKRMYMELLTEQEKHDIENSRVVVANPTHVAIAIYFKPELTPIPYITIREQNQRALAVRRYAEKIGIPVVVDVALARRLFRTHKRYDMVSMDEIHAVVRILLWLQQVEIASGVPIEADPPVADAGAEATPDGPEKTADDNSSK